MQRHGTGYGMETLNFTAFYMSSNQSTFFRSLYRDWRMDSVQWSGSETNISDPDSDPSWRVSGIWILTGGFFLIRVQIRIRLYRSFQIQILVRSSWGSVPDQPIFCEIFFFKVRIYIRTKFIDVIKSNCFVENCVFLSAFLLKEASTSMIISGPDRTRQIITDPDPTRWRVSSCLRRWLI